MTSEDRWRELVRLREELEQTRGWSVSQRVLSLERTRFVFRRNWEDLHSRIGRFKSDPEYALHTFGTVTDRSRWNEFLRDLDPPLLNYAASARALVDHSRNVSKAVLTGNALDTYQEVVKVRFDGNPRSRFVVKLRDYMLHYELPITAGSFHWADSEAAVKAAITLSKAPLLTWDSWTREARRSFWILTTTST